MKVDERKLKILSAIVDEYIKTGEPVGSKTLVNALGISVSSATVRNDMAALEAMGLLEHLHTSSGRVPTYLGYRLYIDKLMKPTVLSAKERNMIDRMLGDGSVTPEAVVETATEALAQLTGLASFNTKNTPKISVITRVEVIPAGRRLYALLILTSTGSIKNKVFRMEFDISNEQLQFFERFLNDHLYGLKFDQLNPSMMQNLAVALGSYMMTLSPLLYAVYELSTEFCGGDVSLKGATNLLASRDFDPNDVVRFISQKNELARMLSDVFDGIHVVFGKENNTFAISNSSVMMAKYNIGDTEAGSLGIIGPVRVDYARMIPYLEYFSDRVTRILSDVVLDEKEVRPDEQQKKE